MLDVSSCIAGFEKVPVVTWPATRVGKAGNCPS